MWSMVSASDEALGLTGGCGGRVVQRAPQVLGYVGASDGPQALLKAALARRHSTKRGRGHGIWRCQAQRWEQLEDLRQGFCREGGEGLLHFKVGSCRLGRVPASPTR